MARLIPPTDSTADSTAGDVAGGEAAGTALEVGLLATRVTRLGE
jgi:hypothetical protein